MKSAYGLALVLVLGVILQACGGTKVIPRETMMAQEAVKTQAQPTSVVAAEPPWEGVTVEMGEEADLVFPTLARTADRALIFQIMRTGWTTFGTPSGESRLGWAELMVSRGDESKSIQIEEDEQSIVFGYTIAVSYAFEKWNDSGANYDPHVRFTVTKP